MSGTRSFGMGSHGSYRRLVEHLCRVAVQAGIRGGDTL